VPSYQYKARDKYGKMKSGQINAETEAAVATYLEQQEFLPIEIAAAPPRNTFAFALSRRKNVPFSELNIFTRQLYVL